MGAVAKIERATRDLTNCVDDLTTLAHSQQSEHILHTNLPELISANRKLYDLVLELQPVRVA